MKIKKEEREESKGEGKEGRRRKSVKTLALV